MARKVEERWRTVEEFCGVLRAAIAEGSAETDRQSAPRAPSATEEHLHEADGSVLVYVPGGEYALGEGESQHRVHLSPFWMGKYPVTHEQYGRFVQATGH